MSLPAGSGYGGAMWWRTAGTGEAAPVTEPAPGGAAADVVVWLGGDLDENATFVELAPRLRGRVIFDLSAVRRINSCGVREWVTFHRDLVPAAVTSLEFRACSAPVVAQLNTIANFRGRARIVSFMAPFVCQRCGRELETLVPVAPAPTDTRLPEVPCPGCGAPMEFDDLAERYLSFLREE